MINLEQEIEKQKKIIEEACWTKALRSEILPFRSFRQLSTWQYILERKRIELKFPRVSVWTEAISLEIKERIESFL